MQLTAENRNIPINIHNFIYEYNTIRGQNNTGTMLGMNSFFIRVAKQNSCASERGILVERKTK